MGYNRHLKLQALSSIFTIISCCNYSLSVRLPVKETIKNCQNRGWEIDVKSMTLTFTREAYILRTPGHCKTNYDEAISFFEPDYRPIEKSDDNIINYSHPLTWSYIRTARNNQICWCKGVAVMTITQMRHRSQHIQNIDYIKRRKWKFRTRLTCSATRTNVCKILRISFRTTCVAHSNWISCWSFAQTDTEDDRKEIFSHN